MIRNSIIFATTLTVAAPAYAQSSAPAVTTVEAAQPIQEQVNFADLDLRDRSAQRTLKFRLMRASERVCLRSEGKFNVKQYMGGKENSCEARTYKEAQSQVATMIARAERGEQLPSMALVVRTN